MNEGSLAALLGRVLRGRLLQRGATAMTAFIARACQQISALALILLAASVLLPAEYGVYTLAVVFVLLLQTLTYSGLYHFVITSKDDEREALDTSFWLMMAISSGGAVVLFIGSPLISAIFRNSEIGEVVRWLALAQPPAAAVAWVSAVYMRQQRLQSFYSIMIAQNLLAMAGGIALVLVWESVFALVAYRYLRVIFGGALYFGCSKTFPGLRFRKPLAGTAMRYASGLYGSRGLTFLSLYAGDVLLGIYLSTAEAGIYRFGVRLARAAMDVVVQPLKNFALARFGAEARADRPLGQLFQRFWSTSFLLLGCGAVAIIVFVEPAIGAFFRPEYGPAAVVAMAFAANGVFAAGSMFVEPFLAARGRTGLAMAFGGASTIVLVLSILVFAPFGLEALSWAQAGVSLVTTIAALMLVGSMDSLEFGPGALRLLESCVLIVAYGVLLHFIYTWLSSVLADRQAAFLASVAIGAAAGLALLAVSYRRRLIYLDVFSD
ncbi:MAG: oligosaccharide flippase family protein [Pseudomonadota bacterium]